MIAAVAHRPGGKSVFALASSGEVASHELPALSPGAPVRLFPLLPQGIKARSMCFNASGSHLALVASNAVYVLRFPLFAGAMGLDDAMDEEFQLVGSLGEVDGERLKLMWHGAPSSSPHMLRMKPEWGLDGRWVASSSSSSSAAASTFSGHLRGLAGDPWFTVTTPTRTPFADSTWKEWTGTLTIAAGEGPPFSMGLRLVTSATAGSRRVVGSVGRVAVNMVQPLLMAMSPPIKACWLPGNRLAVLSSSGCLRVYDATTSLDAPLSSVEFGKHLAARALTPNARPRARPMRLGPHVATLCTFNQAATAHEEQTVFVLLRDGAILLAMDGGGGAMVAAELAPPAQPPDARNGARSHAEAVDLWVSPIADAGTAMHRLWSCGRVDCLAWPARPSPDAMRATSALAIPSTPVASALTSSLLSRGAASDSPLVDMNAKIRAALAFRAKPVSAQRAVLTPAPVLVRCFEVWNNASATATPMRMVAVDADKCVLVRPNEAVLIKALWTTALVQHADQGTNMREFSVASRRIALALAPQAQCTMAADPSTGLTLVCCDGSNRLVTVDIAAAARFITTDGIGSAIEAIDEHVAAAGKAEVADPFAKRVAEVRRAIDALAVVPAELRGLAVDDRRDEQLAVGAMQWLQDTFSALAGDAQLATEEQGVSVVEALRVAGAELREAQRRQRAAEEAQRMMLTAVHADLRAMEDQRVVLRDMSARIAELDAMTRQAATALLQRARCVQPKPSEAETVHYAKLRALASELEAFEAKLDVKALHDQVDLLVAAEEAQLPDAAAAAASATIDADAEALALETSRLLDSLVGAEGLVGRLKNRLVGLKVARASFCVLLVHADVKPPSQPFGTAVRVEEALLSRAAQAALRRSATRAYVPLHVKDGGDHVLVVLLGADVCALVNDAGELLLVRRADAVTREVVPLRLNEGGVVAATWREGAEPQWPVADALASSNVPALVRAPMMW